MRARRVENKKGVGKGTGRKSFTQKYSIRDREKPGPACNSYTDL